MVISSESPPCSVERLPHRCIMHDTVIEQGFRGGGGGASISTCRWFHIDKQLSKTPKVCIF